MAERLTMQEVIEHCETIVAHAEMVGWTDAKIYMEHKQVAEWLKELKHCKDLEEQGRLIELPCKVGSKVWTLFGKTILEYDVTGFRADENGAWLMYLEHYSKEEERTFYYNIEVDKISKTVFLTREEAEAALKGLEQ